MSLLALRLNARATAYVYLHILLQLHTLSEALF